MKEKNSLTSADWQKKFHRRKVLLLAISLGVAIFVSLNTYKIVNRARHKAELVTVVVSKNGISQDQVVSASDLTFRHFRRDQLPEKAIFKKETVLGKSALTDIPKNQILTAGFFIKRKNPHSLSAKLSDNKQAFALGTDWLSSPLPQVQPGDLMDVIASRSYEEKNKAVAEQKEVLKTQTKLLLAGAKVLAVEDKDKLSKGYLVLEVTPEEAKNLLSARALQFLMNIVIR